MDYIELRNSNNPIIKRILRNKDKDNELKDMNIGHRDKVVLRLMQCYYKRVNNDVRMRQIRVLLY